MKSVLVLIVTFLGFQFQANAQSAQTYVTAAAGTAQAASTHAAAAAMYQSYAHFPVVGSMYSSMARSSATSAVIAAQTTFSLVQAAVVSGPTNAQVSSLSNSVDRATAANTTGTNILSGSSACGTKGEGCPIMQ